MKRNMSSIFKLEKKSNKPIKDVRRQMRITIDESFNDVCKCGIYRVVLKDWTQIGMWTDLRILFVEIWTLIVQDSVMLYNNVA